MDADELLERATELLDEAAKHEALAVCFNPDHNHLDSPCNESCKDHLHTCSHGCGEFPCQVHRTGSLVVAHLLTAQGLLNSLASSTEALNKALEDIS